MIYNIDHVCITNQEERDIHAFNARRLNEHRTVPELSSVADVMVVEIINEPVIWVAFDIMMTDREFASCFHGQNYFTKSEHNAFRGYVLRRCKAYAKIRELQNCADFYEKALFRLPLREVLCDMIEAEGEMLTTMPHLVEPLHNALKMRT
ncbi:hypothetical protein AGMMS49992_11670 [Clostridia bacterium]|nr:hypothetical protein AGMMS49992_11670 [Clostridia bacterium]